MAKNKPTTTWVGTKLALGPRTTHEIALRVRELEARLKPTVYDLAEIARLKELLASTGGRDAT